MFTKVIRLIGVAWLFLAGVSEAEIFTVKEISVKGLRRVPYATVIKSLPVKVGDRFDTDDNAKLLRALYKTKLFRKLQVDSHAGKIKFTVTERAVIGSLAVIGNDKIGTSKLMSALKTAGIVEGRELDHLTLNLIKFSLEQQYRLMGHRNVKVELKVANEATGRAEVQIVIHEDLVSTIKYIKFRGNRAFSQFTLRNCLNITSTRPWSFLTGNDKYSPERLETELELIRSYYLDRGYLKMEILPPEIKQLNQSETKQYVGIVIPLREGEIYRVKSVKLLGDLAEQKKELEKIIAQLAPGSVCVRSKVLKLQEEISNHLSDIGYARSEVVPDYKILDSTHEVELSFSLSPRQFIYIRRINFKGNQRTRDMVLRREMRLQEGSKFSLAKIRESLRRIANLGYIKNLDYEVVPVTESENQVDLTIKCEEESSIAMNFNVGFSDHNFMYGSSISDNNFLGTGRSLGLRFENSKSLQYYGVNYYNPYFTENKIGFGANIYFSQNNPNKIDGDISAYKTKIFGVSGNFDQPLSEYTTLQFGLGYEHIYYGTNKKNPDPKVEQFILDYGRVFNFLRWSAALNYSHLDRALFPTDGLTQSLRVEIYTPFKWRGLCFYRAEYNLVFYKPLYKNFILRLGTEWGYGSSFGRPKRLPPFKNYYLGGIGSVRGFETDSICEAEDRKHNTGYNFMGVASVSLILPSYFESVRTSLFCDLGNIGDDRFKLKDVRVSCGIQLEWRTPIMPLTFSLGFPLRKHSWDDRQVFQFNLAAGI